MEEPFILALDTAMSACSVALTGPGICAQNSVPMARGHAERLVPMMDELLKSSGVPYSGLGLIAVTVGPGAFTGLRIGLSTARALGTALDIPVIGVSTLNAIAARYYGNGGAGRLAVILETKRSDYYLRIFENGTPVTDALAADGAAAAPMLQTGDSVAGDAAERFMGSYSEDAGITLIKGFDVPDLVLVARLAREQWSDGNLARAEPLYLRNADVSMAKTRQRTIADTDFGTS